MNRMNLNSSIAMASERKNRLNPAFRLAAVLSLVVWLSAVVVCSAHCAFGWGDASANPQANGEKNSCCHHCGKHPTAGNNASASCLVFKSALTSGKAITLVRPELRLLCELDALPSNSSFAAAVNVRSRRRQAAGLVATPEVYLGAPAFSLPPPSLT
jgi:hypothetical protein